MKNFLKTCTNKLRNNKVTNTCGGRNCEHCCGQWRSNCKQEKKPTSSSSSIPSDVPKGHLVVYVGEKCKRFIIKVTLLKHPLFKALLDQARDEYDFTCHDSKLCIPCDENMFLNVVRCAASPQDDHRRLFLCLS